MNYMKKMIALLLCLSMTLTMLPVGAFAADEDMQGSEEVFTEGEDSNRTESEEKANAYASWTDTEILAEYIRLMEAENEESLDAFVSQLSEAQQSALMESLAADEDMQESAEAITKGEDSNRTEPEEKANAYASWTDTEILAEYIRLMEAENEESLDAFVSQLSEAQQSALMVSLTAMVGDEPDTQSMVASGDCGDKGDNVRWSLDSDGTLTISGTGKMYDYSVGSGSPFYNSSSIRKVVINSGVTSIGDYAFYRCSSLTSITIPNSVTSIGDNAFHGCNSLTSITIPNSVTSIGGGAFDGCSSLTSITIPNSMTSIGAYAFSDCNSLTSITLPNSVTSIGDYAFHGCSSLTSIEVSAQNPKYKSIDGILFSKDGKTLICCPAGKTASTYSIPNSVTSIGATAFRYCSSLTSITIPNSVTSIGAYAFCCCSSLTSITLPNSVTSIGMCAFEYCSSLTSITIPNSVTSIGGGAFDRCSSLRSITIPNSVTSIGADFNYCSSLTSIEVSAQNPKYKSIDGILFSKDGKTLICYPAGKTASTYSIPNSVTSIGACAFYYCSSLTSITIPNSVTSIEEYVFYGCSSLRSITIPNSVTSIGESAFNCCSSLTSITIPNSVTSIGAYAFYYCTSLASITLSNSVTSIGEGAFQSCSSLTDVYYSGSQSRWNAISIDGDNECLTNANIHFDVFSDVISEPLTAVDYLAFSNLAYQDWEIGETVFAKYENSWYSPAMQRDHAVLTNAQLYENIAGWKVVDTSKKLGIGSVGFYAVTFRGETTEGTRYVVAYRGSKTLTDKILSDSDMYDDWVSNDLPFQVGHVYTEQLQNALDYYMASMQNPECSQSKQSDRTVTGHSLGGGLAWIVSMVYGVHAESFNAASSFNALYYNEPELAGKQFKGMDKWNITAHVIDGDSLVGQWDGDYRYLPNIVYSRSSQSTTTGSFKWHSLANFLTVENGEVKMASHSSKTQNNQIYASSTPKLTLGRSGHDYIRLADYGINKRSTIYGGDGRDTIIRAGWVNDEIVGGAVDKGWFKEIDGGLGSDIYYYFEGQGKHWIYDSEGSDVLRLFGFPGGTSVEFVKDYQLDSEYNSMGAVLFNGTPLVYISMNHSGTFDIEVCQDDGTVKQSIRVDGFSWGKISKSLYVACPTTVEILDANGNIVQVLENGIDKTVRTNYGNFYVFNNEDGESVKYFDAIDGYSFRIRGVDDGTMSIAYCENEGEVYSIENVPVSTGMVATIDGGEIPLLEIDSDNDGEVDSSIPLTPENGEPKFFVSLEGLNVLNGYSEVWIDGVKYPVQTGEQGRYVTVSGTEAKTLIAYDYHVGNVNDIHTHYPTGMKVYMLKYGSGGYTVTYVPQFDNILQYSGSSIRIDGVKGIRMITSIDQSKKSALAGSGLADFKLVEYGTLLAQTSKLGSAPLVLDGENVKSNYAYKRGVADPVFARVGDLMQYTNVLVGFNDEQCAEDIAMRPYMIVEDAQGAQYTIYGGIIYRSIGYIAYQNRNSFVAGGAAYNYVWNIIHNVYGDRYDDEYRG